MTLRAPDQEPTASPRDILAEAARLCPEALEVLLVDADGVLVERHRITASPLDAEEVGVQVVAAIPALAGASSASKIGAFQEWMLQGDRGVVIVRRVPLVDMFLVLLVPARTWTGKARFTARVLAGRMAAALA